MSLILKISYMALILALPLSSAFAQNTSGIQMLPPTQAGTTAACGISGGSLLTMIDPGAPGTNKSAINCVPNSTLTGSGNFSTLGTGYFGNNLSVGGMGAFAGSVGIGTTSPTVPLDIQMYSSTPVVAMRGNNNVDLMWFRNGSPSINPDWTYAWDLSNRGTYTTSVDTLNLYSQGGSLTVQSWQQNGNVGIGSTTPQGTLDVENSSGTASFCLNGNCSNNNSLSANGYQVLPSGLIMEWGTVTLVLANAVVNDIREGWGGGGGGAAGDLNPPDYGEVLKLLEN